MKKLILAAVIIAAGWYVIRWIDRETTPEKLRQTEPVKYLKGLHSDVEMAKETRKQVNQRLQQDMKGYDALSQPGRDKPQ